MWNSLHIYIHDYNALDNYLKNDFEEFIAKNTNFFENWFFIRYWLGGPHIRFRFILNEGDQFKYDDIKKNLQKSVSDYLTVNNVDLINYDQFYTEELLKGENITAVYWKEHGQVTEEEYIPEYARYGGKSKIVHSEIIFNTSSKLSFQLSSLPFFKRIIVAFDLIYWTVRLFNYNREFYLNYSEIWKEYYKRDNIYSKFLPFFSKRWNELQLESKPKNIYVNYTNSLKENVEKKDINILCSHIHMTNNRLGVYPELEFELAQILYEISEREELV